MTRLRIKEIAQAQGLDISKLSRKADVARDTVRAMWRDPTKDVNLSTLSKIARALGVEVSDLIEGNGDTNEGNRTAGLCLQLEGHAA